MEVLDNVATLLFWGHSNIWCVVMTDTSVLDASYIQGLLYGLNHNGCIRFSTKLKKPCG